MVALLFIRFNIITLYTKLYVMVGISLTCGKN
jgi:hypothetical protein